MEQEAKKINKAIQENKRIITIGTTSTRVIEHCFNGNHIKSGHGKTDLFIYPEYHFKGVNCLITNFHMPKSTPFLLASAFGGKKLVKQAYEYAISKDFQFYSYGDAMLIL